MALVLQMPGGGDADDAGAENDDLHGKLLIEPQQLRRTGRCALAADPIVGKRGRLMKRHPSQRLMSQGCVTPALRHGVPGSAAQRRMRVCSSQLRT